MQPKIKYEIFPYTTPTNIEEKFFIRKVLLELKNYVRGGSVHHFVIYGEPYADLYVDSFGDSSVPMPLLKLIWKITGSVEEAINIHAILNSVLLSLSMFWVTLAQLSYPSSFIILLI